MHFCDNCENMLYIRLVHADSNNLEYYCRSCGESNKLLTKDNICVSSTEIVIKDNTYLHDVNEYTKDDPTLPRTNIIKCPNELCPSNKEEGHDREVIYLRYDDKNLMYLYLCKYCDKIWKTNDK